MKFKDLDSDSEIELRPIFGCSYWCNLNGNVFEVDRQTGTCFLESPESALRAVLRRQNQDRGVCPDCGADCVKSSLQRFKGADALYLRKNLPK